jgi:hypothetical protein
MSKVSFTPIQPGDAASITAPNAVMTATATATAAIDAENVRQEGLDERSLAFPLTEFVKHESTYGWGLYRGSYTHKAWLDLQAGSSWTKIIASSTASAPSLTAGAPFMVTIGAGQHSYAVVRYSFEVCIEGRISGSTHYVNDSVGFRITRNGAPLVTTERWVQNSIAKSVGGGSGDESARSVESVTVFYYIDIAGSWTFKLQSYIDTHSSTGLRPDTSSSPSWGVASNHQGVIIRNFSASIFRYK